MSLPAFNAAFSETTVELFHKDTYGRFTEKDFALASWREWTTILKCLPVCYRTKGPWIAGGAVRRVLLNEAVLAADIDYFCTDKQQHHLVCARLESIDAVLIETTKHHATYQLSAELSTPMPIKVQVIKSRFLPSLEDHMDNFDYNICQTGWNGEYFSVSVNAYKDLQTKSLVSTGVFHNPYHTWMRVLKYHKQGFMPTQGTLEFILDAAKSHDALSESYS